MPSSFTGPFKCEEQLQSLKFYNYRAFQNSLMCELFGNTVAIYLSLLNKPHRIIKYVIWPEVGWKNFISKKTAIGSDKGLEFLMDHLLCIKGTAAANLMLSFLLEIKI